MEEAYDPGQLMITLQNIKMYHLTTASMYSSSPPHKLTNASDMTFLRKIKSSHVSGPAGGKRKSNCEQRTKNFVALQPGVRTVSETIKEEVHHHRVIHPVYYKLFGTLFKVRHTQHVNCHLLRAYPVSNWTSYVACD